MGRIDVILDDKFEEKLRSEVYKRYGMKRGNLTEAIREALEQWVEKPAKK
ncbi:MAG: hypothetical protein ACREA7_10100 [Nitrosotalea sp.]